MIRKILTSERSFVILISLLILAISFLPMYFQYKITPPEAVYIGLHNSTMDFPSLISEISQGQHGKLTQIVKFTSEPQIGTWIHFPNLIVGWITGPLKIHPIVAYHLARLVFGFILLITIYSFVGIFIKDRIGRIAVFTITLISAPFPKIINENGSLTLSNIPYLSFYTGLDVLKRWTFLPHGMARDILFLLVIIFWISFWLTKEKKLFYLSCLSGFLMGFLSPVNSIILWLTITGASFFLLFGKTINLKNYLRYAIFYLLITLPSSIYIFWVFNNPPWNAGKIWEGVQSYDLELKEYVLGQGIVFFLALPVVLYAIYIFLKKRGHNFTLSNYFLISVPVVTLIFLLTPLHRFIGMNSLRFFSIPLYIFWGFTAGKLLLWLSKKVADVAKKQIYNPVISGLTIGIIVISIPTYVISWNNALKEFDPRYYNVYPPKDFYNGFVWLRNNTNADEIVFCDFMFCNLVPALSGNTAYLGHIASTVNFAKKKKEAEDFYKLTKQEAEAFEFLTSRQIKYVVFAIDEKAYGANKKRYDFLKLRYSNPVVDIYEVVYTHLTPVCNSKSCQSGLW